MDSKEAADILIGILDKYPFEAKEKEAILAAIGVLSWSMLAENRIKTHKAKRDQDNKKINKEF
jgi:hypothetical protein